MKELTTKVQKLLEDMQLTTDTLAKRDKQVRTLLQKIKSQEADLLKCSEETRKTERSLNILKRGQPVETLDTNTALLKRELAQASQKLIAKDHEMEMLREMMASWQIKYRTQEMDRIRKGFREMPANKRLASINSSARIQAFDEELRKGRRKSTAIL